MKPPAHTSTHSPHTTHKTQTCSTRHTYVRVHIRARAHPNLRTYARRHTCSTHTKNTIPEVLSGGGVWARGEGAYCCVRFSRVYAAPPGRGYCQRVCELVSVICDNIFCQTVILQMQKVVFVFVTGYIVCVCVCACLVQRFF